MLEWKDILQLVGSTLGNNALDCVLEFLRVLPEEVIEGRKINLSVCGLQILQTTAFVYQSYTPDITVSNSIRYH